MNIGHGLCGRLWRGGALAAVGVLLCAGVSLASNAVKGASYTGTFKGATGESISFQVSTNGKRVIDLFSETPIKCSGGCGGAGSVTGASAKISRKGTFKIVAKLEGPGSTKPIGTDTITGTFLRAGAAKGTVTSHFASSSSGRTVSWTATS